MHDTYADLHMDPSHDWIMACAVCVACMPRDDASSLSSMEDASDSDTSEGTLTHLRDMVKQQTKDVMIYDLGPHSTEVACDPPFAERQTRLAARRPLVAGEIYPIGQAHDAGPSPSLEASLLLYHRDAVHCPHRRHACVVQDAIGKLICDHSICNPVLQGLSSVTSMCVLQETSALMPKCTQCRWWSFRSSLMTWAQSISDSDSVAAQRLFFSKFTLKLFSSQEDCAAYQLDEAPEHIPGHIIYDALHDDSLDPEQHRRVQVRAVNPKHNKDCRAHCESLHLLGRLHIPYKGPAQEDGRITRYIWYSVWLLDLHGSVPRFAG